MKKEMLFTKKQIQNRIKEIAHQINIDYQNEDQLIIIGVLNGAIFFFSDLCKEIHLPIKIDFIRASSYGSQMTSSGHIKFTKNVELDIKNKTVVIVEDIIDEGFTMHHIIKKIKRDGAKDIKVCTLINKLERRKYDIKIDYYGFEINDERFIIGYGMDYDEKYRNLNDIYIVKEI